MLIGSDLPYIYDAKASLRPLHLTLAAVKNDGTAIIPHSYWLPDWCLRSHTGSLSGDFHFPKTNIYLHFHRTEKVENLWKIGVKNTYLLSLHEYKQPERVKIYSKVGKSYDSGSAKTALEYTIALGRFKQSSTTGSVTLQMYSCETTVERLFCAVVGQFLCD